ncbi:MAG: AtpZ/AtpI family protein [Bacteroidota bacterium]
MHPDDERSTPGKLGSVAKAYREVGPYLGLGLQLAVTIVFFFLVGKWLDGVFSTTPILMVVGGFVGAVVGLYSFLKTVISLNKKQAERRKADSERSGDRATSLDRRE